MSDETPGRSSATTVLVIVYAILFAAAVGLALLGENRDDQALRTAGLVGLVLVPALAPLAIVVSRSRGESSGPESGQLDRLAESMRASAAQMALSDDARRVLNRRQERDLLCRAIEDDIQTQEWDAALILVRELAERFGFRVEAEGFRQRIEHGRSASIEQRVDEAFRTLDAMIVRGQWNEARSQAEQIVRLFPESPRTEGVRHRVERARSRYKGELERRFLHAAENERVDEAFELLSELDQYLTEAEAEPLGELARGVVGKARQNLGVQFKLAVQDRDWSTASVLGARIIESFPNTRMADEVRQVIDEIRSRAATAGFAEGGAVITAGGIGELHQVSEETGSDDRAEGQPVADDRAS